MRSIKLSLITAATTALSLSVATAAFADPPAADTIPPTPPVSQPAPSTTSTSSTTTTTGADSDPTATTATTPSTSTTYRSNSDTTVYQKRTPNRFFLYSGLGVFAGSYVTTAAVAGSEGSIKDHDLYIPIAGPWIDLASRNWNNTRGSELVLIFGSGVLQGVGAGMAVASFFIPEKYATATIAAGPVKMHLTPTAAAGSGGVGVYGTF